MYWFAAYNEIRYRRRCPSRRIPLKARTSPTTPCRRCSIPHHAALGSFGFFKTALPRVRPRPHPARAVSRWSLRVIFEPACRAGDGNWQGPGVPCSFGLCPQPSGACCYPDGSCIPSRVSMSARATRRDVAKCRRAV